MCLRSDHNYPSLVAVALHVPAFRDVSCTGAATVDLTQSQHPYPLTSLPPQLDALSPDTGVVTLTIGGNDIGFSNVVVTCGQLSLLDPFGAPCEEHYTAGGTDTLAAAVAATAPKVAAVLQAIHQRAPHARVALVGYLDILPVVGPGCWPLVPMSPAYPVHPNSLGMQADAAAVLSALR